MREGEGHSTAGMSIIEMLWEQADVMYDQLMELSQDDPWTVEAIEESLSDMRNDGSDAQEIADYWELRGKLGGLTFSLSRMLHTYDPVPEAMEKIKDELHERWESVQEDEGA